MFTGIIETTGTVTSLRHEDANLHLEISSPISAELKIDQSVAHNGVCLTVVRLNQGIHTVTAIKETLDKTNLRQLKEGDLVNLERSMLMNGRLDGHIVQGHVDQTATCLHKQEQGGSWMYTFGYDPSKKNITVEKGSVCVNGISLTVVDSGLASFSVAVIPYTFEHTNLKKVMPGNLVNVEFDIIGKYVGRYMTITRRSSSPS